MKQNQKLICENKKSQVYVVVLTFCHLILAIITLFRLIIAYFLFLLQYVIIFIAISSKGGEIIEAIITIDNDFNITYTFAVYSNINMASHYHKFTSLILVLKN